MKPIKTLAIASSLFCFSSNTPVLAQSDSESELSSLVLDEIIVTGRKREESLQDVPVSASVVSNALIEDAGIEDLYDLFEMIPGLHYDEEDDRLAALPSIRGVQANDIASNRTKVTAFIDGMPVLGSQGSIGFNGFQQVEVYRGPQSAAFGRSTFGGAINYVTQDPTEEFEGSVGVNFSDYGTRIATLNFGGPITDNLGFLISYQHEDSGSPSEYHANGNAAENLETGANIGQSDGTEYGARTGDNVSAKFVFEPSDDFKAAFTYAHVETHDQQQPELYLTEEARNACFEGNGIRAATGMTSIYLQGEMDCDWSSFRQNYANHDDEAWLINNPALLASLVANAEAAGAVDDFAGTGLTVEQQILEVARAYSIPLDERGTKSERDRFTLQLDKFFDNGSGLQFSYMHSEETFQRASDVSVYYYDPDNVGIVDDGAPNAMAPGSGVEWDPGAGNWVMQSGMGYPRVIGASEGDIEEDYAELRWVSPAEDRLRYVIGASYYDYAYLEERYGNDMRDGGLDAVAFGAELNGMVDLYETLTGTPFEADDSVIGEDTVNTAAFFNVGYDITDQLTLSVEGRYQSDEISATNVETDVTEEVTTNSFVPRVALTYNLNDDTSFYFQWSQGVNPAGINLAALDVDIIENLASGIGNALIPYDAALDVDVLTNDTGVAGADELVDIYNQDDGFLYTDSTFSTLLTGATYNSGFTPADFISYDEEKLTNIEFGFKGTLLDGQLNYSGAIYSIDWQDQIQNGSIDIDSPCANNANAGTAGIGPCTYDGAEYFYVSTSAGGTANVGLNFGDVKINGIELEGTYRVNENIDVRAQASLLKAEYDDFCDIQLFANTDLTFNPDYLDALGLEVRQPGEGDTLTSTCYVTDGNEVAGQPKFSGSISPSYSTDIAGMRFSARLDLRHEGSQYATSGNFSKYAAVTTSNLSLSLSGDAWSTTLYVNNLTDVDSPRRISSGGDDTDVFGLIDTEVSDAGSNDFLGDNYDLVRDNYRFSPRTPRTIGLRASYRF